MLSETEGKSSNSAMPRPNLIGALAASLFETKSEMPSDRPRYTIAHQPLVDYQLGATCRGRRLASVRPGITDGQ